MNSKYYLNTSFTRANDAKINVLSIECQEDGRACLTVEAGERATNLAFKMNELGASVSMAAMPNDQRFGLVKIWVDASSIPTVLGDASKFMADRTTDQSHFVRSARYNLVTSPR